MCLSTLAGVAGTNTLWTANTIEGEVQRKREGATSEQVVLSPHLRKNRNLGTLKNLFKKIKNKQADYYKYLYEKYKDKNPYKAAKYLEKYEKYKDKAEKYDVPAPVKKSSKSSKGTRRYHKRHRKR